MPLVNKLCLLLFLLLSITSCTKKVQHIARHDYVNFNIDNNLAEEDAKINEILKPYQTEIDSKINETIGKLTETMEKNSPSSTLCNFVADAVFEQFNHESNQKIDLFISNYGGIRTNSFAKGDITVADIFDIMPFDNTISILNIKHNELKKFLDDNAKNGGWPISLGTSYFIKDSLASDIIINNGPLSEKTYRLALPDYVANRNTDNELYKVVTREDTGILVRDLMIRYVKRLKTISPDYTKRIKR
jgi:2',3'-cyclic-nucleotide 2'-phosphodiesterase (5'-nucleotidase family)